ncbi:molybdopterin dinucleotide binding domain protein, partial [Vibrio parahaemolyticus V-223/04]
TKPNLPEGKGKWWACRSVMQPSYLMKSILWCLQQGVC